MKNTGLTIDEELELLELEKEANKNRRRRLELESSEENIVKVYPGSQWIPTPLDKEDMEEYEHMREVASAYFRTESPVTNWIYAGGRKAIHWIEGMFAEEETEPFDLGAKLEQDQVPEHDRELFAGVDSLRDYEYVKEGIEQERKDEAILENADWTDFIGPTIVDFALFGAAGKVAGAIGKATKIAKGMTLTDGINKILSPLKPTVLKEIVKASGLGAIFAAADYTARYDVDAEEAVKRAGVYALVGGAFAGVMHGGGALIRKISDEIMERAYANPRVLLKNEMRKNWKSFLKDPGDKIVDFLSTKSFVTRTHPYMLASVEESELVRNFAKSTFTFNENVVEGAVPRCFEFRVDFENAKNAQKYTKFRKNLDTINKEVKEFSGKSSEELLEEAYFCGEEALPVNLPHREKIVEVVKYLDEQVRDMAKLREELTGTAPEMEASFLPFSETGKGFSIKKIVERMAQSEPIRGSMPNYLPRDWDVKSLIKHPNEAKEAFKQGLINQKAIEIWENHNESLKKYITKELTSNKITELTNWEKSELNRLKNENIDKWVKEDLAELGETKARASKRKKLEKEKKASLEKWQKEELEKWKKEQLRKWDEKKLGKRKRQKLEKEKWQKLELKKRTELERWRREELKKIQKEDLEIANNKKLKREQRSTQWKETKIRIDAERNQRLSQWKENDLENELKPVLTSRLANEVKQNMGKQLEEYAKSPELEKAAVEQYKSLLEYRNSEYTRYSGSGINRRTIRVDDAALYKFYSRGLLQKTFNYLRQERTQLEFLRTMQNLGYENYTEFKKKVSEDLKEKLVKLKGLEAEEFKKKYDKIMHLLDQTEAIVTNRFNSGDKLFGRNGQLAMDSAQNLLYASKLGSTFLNSISDIKGMVARFKFGDVIKNLSASLVDSVNNGLRAISHLPKTEQREILEELCLGIEEGHINMRLRLSPKQHDGIFFGPSNANFWEKSVYYTGKISDSVYRFTGMTWWDDTLRRTAAKLVLNKLKEDPRWAKEIPEMIRTGRFSEEIQEIIYRDVNAIMNRPKMADVPGYAYNSLGKLFYSLRSWVFANSSNYLYPILKGKIRKGLIAKATLTVIMAEMINKYVRRMMQGRPYDLSTEDGQTEFENDVFNQSLDTSAGTLAVFEAYLREGFEAVKRRDPARMLYLAPGIGYMRDLFGGIGALLKMFNGDLSYKTVNRAMKPLPGSNAWFLEGLKNELIEGISGERRPK